MCAKPKINRANWVIIGSVVVYAISVVFSIIVSNISNTSSPVFIFFNFHRVL